jgi:hypothetical protein
MAANTLTAKLQAAFNARLDKAVANSKLTAANQQVWQVS